MREARARPSSFASALRSLSLSVNSGWSLLGPSEAEPQLDDATRRELAKRRVEFKNKLPAEQCRARRRIHARHSVINCHGSLQHANLGQPASIALHCIVALLAPFLQEAAQGKSREISGSRWQAMFCWLHWHSMHCQPAVGLPSRTLKARQLACFRPD